MLGERIEHTEHETEWCSGFLVSGKIKGVSFFTGV